MNTPDMTPAEMQAVALRQALVRLSPADPHTDGIALRLTLRLGNGRPIGEVVFTADEVSELIARVETPACHAGADDDPTIDGEIADFTGAASALAALSAGYGTHGPAPATADSLPEVSRTEVDDVLRGLTDLLGEQQ